MRRRANLLLRHARARAESLAGYWDASSRAASSPAQACCANCHATGTTGPPDPGQTAPSWTSSIPAGLLIAFHQPALAFQLDHSRQESGPAHCPPAWEPMGSPELGHPSMHPHVPTTALPDAHHARSARSTHMHHMPGQHAATWGVSGQHSSFAASGMWLGQRRSHGTPWHLNQLHPSPSASRGMPSGWPSSHRHISTHGVQYQTTQEGVEACVTVIAASMSELGGDTGGGTGAAGGGLSRPPGLLGVLQEAALGVQWVHDTTGLPWWASIPLTTLAVRTALLPFSMWQARTVRTNYQVYREAVALTDKQLGAIKETASPLNAMEQASRVRRGKLLLSNFGLLRTKTSAPHPAWILINPLVQMPVFVLLGGSLRLMAGVQWPGLTEGGALWFRDMTQAALIPGSPVFSLAPAVPWDLPLGPAGLILPLAMSAMTLTSLRLGVGAAGVSLAPLPKDTMGRFLRILPYVLYSLTILNTWVALQLPHAPLMHWVASSSFTLGLQLALQQPRFRAAFSLPSPSELQAVLKRAVNQRLLQLSEMGGTLGPGRGYALSLLPDTLIKQVSQEQDADVLVVLGAQHSAQKRYREALYCLDKALQIEPTHVRAHYSRGQVFSLNNRWTDAESCFRRAAELAGSPGEKGQALYCIATALHTQGKLEGAVEAYRAALPVWTNQPVVSYSLANALMQLGRPIEAKAVVDAILHPAEPGSGPHPAGAFLQPLKALAGQIEAGLQQLETSKDEAGEARPKGA